MPDPKNQIIRLMSRVALVICFLYVNTLTNTSKITKNINQRKLRVSLKT